MSVTEKIQDCIAHEDARISNLEAQLPELRDSLQRAERHAERVEADLLVHDAIEGVMQAHADVTDETLRRAKVAEHQRRRAVEQAERELRVARRVLTLLRATDDRLWRAGAATGPKPPLTVEDVSRVMGGAA